MSTPRQLKNIQSIDDPEIKRKYLKYIQLPEDVQQLFFSVESADTIFKIGQQNNLKDEQISRASYNIGLLLLGEIRVADFVKKIQEECNLSENAAVKLANEINQIIFLPVQENLKQIHQLSQWPSQFGQEQPIPESNGPRLDRNLVDLKNQ